MRKCKIESRDCTGRIKKWTVPPLIDIIRSVSGVNMLRRTVVLDFVAHVVSISPAYLTDRWCFVR